MIGAVGPLRVRDVRGEEWLVRRRWLARRIRLPRWRGPLVENWDVGYLLPVDSDIGGWLVGLAVVVLAVLVVIPAVLFGIELLAVGIAIAASVLARAIWGRRWVIEAQNQRTYELHQREVKGWRQSTRVMAEIAAAIEAGASPGDIHSES